MLTILALSAVASAQTVILGDVDPTVEVGENVTVGEGAVVQAGAVLEDGVFIANGARIGANTRIGRDSVVGRRAVILNDVVIPSNAVIGRTAFIGANSHFTEQLTVGYGAFVGGGVRMTVLTAGNLTMLGGEAPEGEITVDCPVLTMARETRIAVQAPYTLKCDDPGNIGVVVGTNVDVEPGVTLGAGVRIRKQAHIGQRAVIGPRSRIDRDSCVGDSAAIGEGSRLGAGSRTSQDSELISGTNIARAADLGLSADECGVWPDGEPGTPTGVSENGYRMLTVSGPADPDPGSRPALTFGTTSGGLCGGNDTLFFALDDNTSNSGAFQDTSLRELDLVTGAQIIHHARTPDIRSIAVAPDGNSVFVGYGFASTSSRPEVVARRFQVFGTDLLTGVETSLVNTTIAGPQRVGIGIYATDDTVTVLASQGSSNSSNSSAILSIDRATNAVSFERTLPNGQSFDVFAVSPDGRQHWLRGYVATRLESDGTTTAITIGDPNERFYIQSATFGPDGLLYVAEVGSDFERDEDGNYFIPARIRTVNMDSGESSVFADTIAGASFYPLHVQVDCDGDVWVSSQDIFGDGGSSIFEVSADGSSQTLHLTNPAPRFELGVFALAPE